MKATASNPLCARLLLSLVAAAAVALTCARHAGAAETPMPTPSAASAPSRTAAGQPEAVSNSYKTTQAETLDKVIQKALGESPLRIELLRQAFVQLNPQVFPGGKINRLRSGVVLQVPDHQQLMRTVLLPLLQPAEASAFLGVAASNTPEERRRWVRFP